MWSFRGDIWKDAGRVPASFCVKGDFYSFQAVFWYGPWPRQAVVINYSCGLAGGCGILNCRKKIVALQCFRLAGKNWLFCLQFRRRLTADLAKTLQIGGEHEYCMSGPGGSAGAGVLDCFCIRERIPGTDKNLKGRA